VAKRFGKFGLSLHPEKTRLIEFRPPRVRGPNGPSEPCRRPTFDLLGFTHYWTKSRRGYWVIKQKTATDRLSRAVRRVGQWCRDHRHLPVGEQHKELVLKVRGHYAYYGITGNAWMLKRFLRAVLRRWRYWLDRRSQRSYWTFERLNQLLARMPMPQPIPVHSSWRPRSETVI
jgi:RNA-directed DNA polymerase